MQALKDYKTDMIIKQLNTQKEVEKARKNRTECLERDSIRQMAMMNTQKGGFQLENYKSLTPEEGEGKKTKDIQKENEYRNKMAAMIFSLPLFENGPVSSAFFIASSARTACNFAHRF